MSRAEKPKAELPPDDSDGIGLGENDDETEEETAARIWRNIERGMAEIDEEMRKSQSD